MRQLVVSEPYFVVNADTRLILVTSMVCLILVHILISMEQPDAWQHSPSHINLTVAIPGAGISRTWFNHNILGRRDARTTIIRKPGGEP